MQSARKGFCHCLMVSQLREEESRRESFRDGFLEFRIGNYFSSKVRLTSALPPFTVTFWLTSPTLRCRAVIS